MYRASFSYFNHLQLRIFLDLPSQTLGSGMLGVHVPWLSPESDSVLGPEEEGTLAEPLIRAAWGRESHPDGVSCLD